MMHIYDQRPWLRRAIFLGGNFLAALLIVMGVVTPLRSLFADRDGQIVHQHEALARWQAIAAQEAIVRAAADQVAVNQNEFLVGKNEGAIQADAQARLKGMIEKAGARLRSIRGLQPQIDRQVRYVGSRVELFGTLQTVQRAIYAIESAKPYLFVTGAVLRLAPALGQVNPAQEPLIEAQLDVFGVMVAEASGR